MGKAVKDDSIALVDNNLLDKQIYIAGESYWEIQEATDIDGDSKFIIATKEIYHSATNSLTRQVLTSKKRLPSHQDNLVLLTLISLSQQKNTNTLETTYYEIAKTMGVVPSKKTYQLIKDAIDVLHSLHIRYERNFYSNGKYINFSTYIISSVLETNKKLKIRFEPDFIKTMVENRYFTSIVVNEYSALKSSFQRRLYDILSKSFSNSLSFEIRWDKLREKLEDDSQYRSYFIKKLKRAINSINKNTYLKISFEDFNGLIVFRCQNEEKVRFLDFIYYLKKDPQKYSIDDDFLDIFEKKAYFKKADKGFILVVRDEQLRSYIENNRKVFDVLRLFKVVNVI